MHASVNYRCALTPPEHYHFFALDGKFLGWGLLSCQIGGGSWAQLELTDAWRPTYREIFTLLMIKYYLFLKLFFTKYFWVLSFFSRNMWNYVDVITLSCHAIIFVLRVASIIKGGDPYHNRLLEAINCLYGVNTLLLVLRFSSILEINKTVGPLQLALFRMIVDLMIILVQFVFVILAFSVAITMIYTAEMSYLTPAREKESNRTQVKRWGLRMFIFFFFSLAAFN